MLEKVEKAYHIVMLCLWGVLTLFVYYKVIVSEGFTPNSSERLVLVLGPVLMIVEIIWLVIRRKKEKQAKNK